MRLPATIPARQRSKVITSLIEGEVKMCEQKLYDCALAIEHKPCIKKWKIGMLH